MKLKSHLSYFIHEICRFLVEFSCANARKEVLVSVHVSPLESPPKASASSLRLNRKFPKAKSHLIDPLPLLIACHASLFFLFFFFFHLTYSRWTSSLPSCLWSQRIFPSLPGSRFTNFLSRCKFSTLTTRQPMVEFYLLTFPRFPLRKKEHKSYFGKNRTHGFRTSRYAGYPLDHSGDEYPLYSE